MEQWERVKRQMIEAVALYFKEAKDWRLMAKRTAIERYTRLVQAAVFAEVLAWSTGQEETIRRAANLREEQKAQAEELQKHLVDYD